ncbi:hypothetical protein [Photorhabdus khanii]|uniref:hypothetical protein n=1 Tax=Photorhabdus khanii TaxID=1004150 RepID=UPI0018649814|nr:hypothetical protein [Photorhabdus khanii]
MCAYVTISVSHSISSNNEEFRLQLEAEMKKDGDTSLATWIKRILRKELLARGIEPKG